MNSIKEPVSIEINGEQRSIRLEWRDFASAEMSLGIPLISPNSQQFWRCPYDAWRLQVMLFVGLQHCIPGLTLEQVKDMVTWQNHVYLDERMAEAIRVYVEPAARTIEIDSDSEQEAAPAAPFDPVTFGRIYGHLLASTSASPRPSSGVVRPASGTLS